MGLHKYCTHCSHSALGRTVCFVDVAASRLGRRPKRLKSEHSDSGSSSSSSSGASSRSSHQHHPAAIAPNPATLTPLQISKLSMAELQQLLQSIQQGKAPMPPGLLNMMDVDQSQLLASGAFSATSGATGTDSHLSQPSPDGCDSGYASVASDTPSGRKSQSPAVMSQGAPPQQQQVPVHSQLSVASSGSEHSPGGASYRQHQYSDDASVYTDMDQQQSPGRIDAAAHYDTKAHVAQQIAAMQAGGGGGYEQLTGQPQQPPQLDNHMMMNHANNPAAAAYSNLNNDMNNVLSHMKQEQLSPPSLSNMNLSSQPHHGGGGGAERVSDDNTRHAMETQIRNAANIKLSPSSPNGGGGGGGGARNYPEKVQVKYLRSTAAPNTLGAVGTMVGDARATPRGEKLKLVDTVMQTIIEAHMDTCIWTADKLKEAFQKYEDLKQRNGGSMVSRGSVVLVCYCFGNAVVV